MYGSDYLELVIENQESRDLSLQGTVAMREKQIISDEDISIWGVILPECIDYNHLRPELRRRNSEERYEKKRVFSVRTFADKDREPGDFLRLPPF